MKVIFQTVCLITVFSLGSVHLYAQQFELKKDGKVAQLDLKSDWYVVQKLGNDDECCNSRRFLGEIVNVTQDSVQLEAKQFETKRTDSEKSYLSKVKFNTKAEFPIYTISKSDIKNIQEKGSGLKKVFIGAGGILIFTSVATAIHALIVDDDDRKALLLSAGIQLGASIALISIGNTGKEKYRISEDAWQF